MFLYLMRLASATGLKSRSKVALLAAGTNATEMNECVAFLVLPLTAVMASVYG